MSVSPLRFTTLSVSYTLALYRLLATAVVRS